MIDRLLSCAALVAVFSAWGMHVSAVKRYVETRERYCNAYPAECPPLNWWFKYVYEITNNRALVSK